MTPFHSPHAGDAIAAPRRWHRGRVLVVESDRDLRRFLCRALREDGYVVSEADPAERIEEAAADGCDCVVLGEVPSPRVGLGALGDLRARGVTAPVLLLAARHASGSRTRGRECGADDRLERPFALRELLARVHALVHGPRTSHSDIVLRTADLQLDRLTRRVTLSGRSIDLSGREFALLEFLMRNAGHTVSRSHIAAAVWDRWFDSGTNVIDVYVSYLRKKLRGGRQAVTIGSVRGVGYRLDAADP
jgi:two-component system, OmpR family, response regulator